MQPAKILLVEDDQFTRELYQELLTTAGFSVDVASDGNQGWEKASQNTYDLILLDILMPKIDGLTLLKKVKAELATPTNVVMLSVLNQDNYVKDALSHGAQAYLMKHDLTPDQLVNEVKKALSVASKHV